MPLPNSGAEWPPPHLEKVRAEIIENDTWYAGDPEALGSLYAGTSSTGGRPSQYKGGVVGKVARWWWGTPPAKGEQSTKLHVPLASDLCATSSDLLFSEPPKLTATDTESPEADAFLDDLLEDGLVSVLQEGAELGAAHGGVYLRNVWNKDVRERPWTSVVHADMAVPTFRWGRLHEVTFWQILPGTDNSQVVWRLLEHHAVGSIEHALFKGTPDNLGQLVPLEDHPDSAYLADLVDANSQQRTGLTRLTAQYVPNMLPNRLHRGSNQGRSDLQGLLPLLDSLDEAFTSWRRDIRHGKSRIHMPAQYLESNGPGDGAVADLDREVYVPIEGVLASGDSGLLIDAQQFKIRVQEHMDTVNDWVKRIIESAGYSTQSLTSGTGGAVTAAEVHSHERRSYMTRGKKIRRWTTAIVEHVETQIEIANKNLGLGLGEFGVKVEFEDGVQDAALNIAQTAQTLFNAQAASHETLVKMVNPDWDQKQVDAEVAKIMEQYGSGAPLPDPEDAGF